MRDRPTPAPGGRRDPSPYDGPIARADGTRPFNRYLWPSENWVFYLDHPRPHVDYDMRIEFAALNDGRFSTCGFVHSIEGNRDVYGRPCVFATREAAIRTSAARMIRLCRRMVRGRWGRVGVTAENADRIINWARAVVAREAQRPAPAPIRFITPKPPAPPRQLTGLPLFDMDISA